MTTAVYRYQYVGLNIAKIVKRVPLTPTLGSFGPLNVVDITADTTAKLDLDDAMAIEGYTYLSTNPATTPAQAVAIALKLRETGGPTDLTMAAVADGEFLKRVGVNIVGAAAGGSSFDIRDVLINEHFIASNMTSLSYASYAWRTGRNAAGANWSVTGEAGHPGILRLQAGTGANGRAEVHAGVGFENVIAGGGNPLVFEALVSPRVSVASADVQELLVGIGDANWDTNGVNPLAAGIFLRYQPGADSHWVGVVRSASTETVRASTTAPVSGNWYRLGFTLTPTGTPSVQFTLNGVNFGAAVTTNIPSSLLSAGVRAASNAGSLNPELWTDYLLLTQITTKET